MKSSFFAVASELGHSEVYLLVHANNLAAVSLYLSFGFEAILEDAIEVAQWQTLEAAAQDSRAAALTEREVEVVGHSPGNEAISQYYSTTVEAKSGDDWWTGALRARISMLAKNPDEFLTEVRRDPNFADR